MNTPPKSHVVRALTIAGSDSGGGAGIQADLKTMHQFGVYGTSVITALTAQNTVGVQSIHEIDAPFVRHQLTSVLDDLGTDAVKTGMLANAAIIREVSDVLRERRAPHLVIDPVMVAKGGASLISDEAVDVMTTQLFPLAEVITPNLPEASVLCGQSLTRWAGYHQAVVELAAFGAKTVILKGGHLEPRAYADASWAQKLTFPVAVDIVYSDQTFTYFLTKRIHSTKTHGTGCTFSAAITSMLAKGSPLLESIATAKSYVYKAIERAQDWDVGAGHGPTNHWAPVLEDGCFEPSGVYLFENDSWTSLNT